MSKTFKDWSKDNWSRTDQSPANNEQLQIGCLQRIADATELMAKSHSHLIQEAERYKKWYYEERAKIESLRRSIVTHKANYTRLKNKMEAMKKDEKPGNA